MLRTKLNRVECFINEIKKLKERSEYIKKIRGRKRKVSPIQRNTSCLHNNDVVK